MEASSGLFLISSFLLSQCLSAQQGVSLNSSTLKDELVSEVRRGENITFRCITRGSHILAWSSDEYFNRIEFLVVDDIGTVYTPNTYTTAELLSAYTDGNGEAVIESRLNIVVQSNIQRSSITVTCHNVGTGETRAISFQLSNAPVLTCDGTDVCTGQFRNFSCEIRDSVILAWKNAEYIGPNGDRLEFLSTEPVGTVKFSEINPKVFANLTGSYEQNGVQVMTCDLSISEFLYHPDTVDVVCVNVGLGTEGSYEVTVNDNCETTTTSDNSAISMNELTGTVDTSHSAEVKSGVHVISISIAILLIMLDMATIFHCHCSRGQSMGKEIQKY